jgi:hypothetical protein
MSFILGVGKPASVSHCQYRRPVCTRLWQAGLIALAYPSGTFVFNFIRHLIISEISFQEDINPILTGLEIYFSLL